MSGVRKIWLLVGILLALGLGVAAAFHWASPVSESDDIPSVQVKRGDLDSKIHATGEVRATLSAMLAAPQIGGGSLQITHLLHTGVPVKKNDVVIEFDPAEQQFKMEQSRSELEEADEEIAQAKADASVQAARDKVALLTARFDVRRAELEVGKNELASAIDARKNDLALDQARRVLAQLEQDVKSHTVSGQAMIGLAQERRHKAKLAMEQAQQNIEKMRVRAPLDGVVAVEKNEGSNGEFFGGGMALPDYHEGDQTGPGTTIARVIDPATMEVSAKLDERERSNVKVGQAARIQLDALPNQTFQGSVKTISGIASRNFFDEVTGGQFEVTVQLPGSDPRLRAGFTVQMVIEGNARKNILYVPRQAVFMKDGKRVVYVKRGKTYEAREVKVEAETESRTAVDGLAADTQIAFVDPTIPRKSSSHSSTEPSLSGGTR
ncbi:MAG: HlyD family efflux transporter periplasmic adaptor subunit [Acidobacteria bacterium]|nr:HlyD family efflux transporter periplasmic adaptor subunit [Acidobacteriota bacterium]